MANLILKPSTGGVLKIQNQEGTVDALSVSTGGNLTAAGTLGVTGAVTTSSTLGVTGNTTLSGTANNIGTVTSGNISDSAIVYPSGTIISGKILHHDNIVASHISTTSTSTTLIDSGINGSYTPHKSSGAGGSWLHLHFFSSFSQCQDNGIHLNCAMTSTNDTTFDANDMLFRSVYYAQKTSGTQMHNCEWMVNSVSSGNQESNYATNLTSYAAGTTYYFRVWWRVDGGTGYLGHSNGTYTFRIQEIMI